MRQLCTPRAQPVLAPERLCALTPDPMALSSAGSPSSDSCPGLSNGEEAGLEKPSLEPRKSLGEEGLQRGPDALGPAYREDEEEDEEEEEQTDPKKPTTDEVRPASGMGGGGMPSLPKWAEP